MISVIHYALKEGLSPLLGVELSQFHIHLRTSQKSIFICKERRKEFVELLIKEFENDTRRRNSYSFSLCFCFGVWRPEDPSQILCALFIEAGKKDSGAKDLPSVHWTTKKEPLPANYSFQESRKSSDAFSRQIHDQSRQELLLLSRNSGCLLRLPYLLFFGSRMVWSTFSQIVTRGGGWNQSLPAGWAASKMNLVKALIRGLRAQGKVPRRRIELAN